MNEQEPKWFNPAEAARIEVTGMRILNKVELLRPGSLVNTVDTAEFDRPVEEIVQNVRADVFAIRTFRRVEGTVLVDGKPVQVSSRNYDYSGTTFIDGQIMPLHEAEKAVPNSTKLIAYFRENGCNRVILTRTGDLEPFEEGDQNIILPKKRMKDNNT